MTASSCFAPPGAPLAIGAVHSSSDGITRKYVLHVDHALIECTYVDRPEKHIICFSTAVGCPIGCGFCRATQFVRRLSAREMVSECLTVAASNGVNARSAKPILFSAMGEGEPLLTEGAGESLLETMLVLQQHFPGARFAVSTTAIRPGVVHWLADHAPLGLLKLQLSLHGPTDVVRGRLIPVAAPLQEVIAAGEYYQRKHPGRVEWNYVLVENVNDSESDAIALAAALSPAATVKLNRLNAIEDRALRPSTRRAAFECTLREQGVNTEYYETDGADVAAACGQLKSRLVGERNRRAVS